MQIAITRKGKEVTMDMGAGVKWIWTFQTIASALAFTMQLTKKWVKVRVNYGNSSISSS